MKSLYALALLTRCSPAAAQTSEDFAKMGTKTYSLWSCAVLAGQTRGSR